MTEVSTSFDPRSSKELRAVQARGEKIDPRKIAQAIVQEATADAERDVATVKANPRKFVRRYTVVPGQK